MPGSSPGRVCVSDPLFDAVLTPNDSGTATGRLILVCVLSVYFAIILHLWLSLHAWPAALHSLLVGGFVVWSMIGDRRRRREWERIRVWSDRTLVERVDSAGRASTSEWQTAWLRVAIAPDRAGVPLLTLASHGRQVTLGRFLNIDERQELARALRDAIQDGPGCRSAAVSA